MVRPDSARTEVEARADENPSQNSNGMDENDSMVPMIRAVATCNVDLELSLQSSAEDPLDFRAM